MTVIDAKKIVKRFSAVRVVDQFSIRLEAGQITGIIGPNGSGKTTLVDLLSGILPIDSGEIIVDEIIKFTKILPYQASFYGITRTFQNVRLFEQMTVLDNILVVVTEKNILGSLFEKHDEYRHKLAKEVLHKVGLWEKKNQLAFNLSYGQRKLLEVARALATKAEVYLFDEPFAGLFPETRNLVANIFRELKQENKVVVLVEHDMDLIRKLCDYIFIMDEGKLLVEGKPDLVLDKKEVIEAYFGQ